MNPKELKPAPWGDFYPLPSSPYWRQFNDPARAYSNYAAMFEGYLTGRVTSPPEFDYQAHAQQAANFLKVPA